jgi:hypothetical protein
MRIAADRELARLEQHWRTPLRLAEAETVEYEWGWMFSYEPRLPDADLQGDAKLAYGCILVDRLSGRTVISGTSGPVWAILKLLGMRSEPDRGALLSEESRGGLIHGVLTDRAITPLPRPGTGSDEPAG